jgi:hypothetical protein
VISLLAAIAGAMVGRRRVEARLLDTAAATTRTSTVR